MLGRFAKRYGGNFSRFATKSPLVVKRECSSRSAIPMRSNQKAATYFLKGAMSEHLLRRRWAPRDAPWFCGLGFHEWQGGNGAAVRQRRQSRGSTAAVPRRVGSQAESTLHHSLTVRTTLEVGRSLTTLPPNSFMIASSYCGSVFTGSFALTCTILYPPALS
jgi:hypothetical protein